MHLQWLLDRFTSFQDREAIIWKGKVYTYNWLSHKTKEFLQILKSQNIHEGQIVSVEGDYSPTISALIIALIHNGNIIVPLSSAIEENKKEFLQIADVSKRVVFDKEDHYEMIDTDNKIESPLLERLIKEKESGLVLFSSGSTGKSKGALHNFNLLLEKYKKQQKTLRTLIFLLIDHIGGINTLFYILANGGTMVIETSKNPGDICRAIEKYGVELLPTSPTFMNLLMLSEEYKNYNLTSLKLITYGTEPMPVFTLKKFNEIFPHIQLKQTYGLSELGIMATKSESNSSLWVKLGGDGYETKVVEGTLWIKAKSSMLGYLNAPNPFDEDGWFNTQDMVLQKGDYFMILGRQSEIINVGGEKVYPAEVESVILEVENIKDVTVRGEANPLMGNIVCAKVNLLYPEDLLSVKKKIKAYCQKRLEKFKIPIKIEVAEENLFNPRFKRMRRE
ncbi:long-chain fatty acid--CoA ligase [Clostridium formicaceticum]|uniref:AMP-dependent synthetase n=1 Tax=Clostridium formicaceticum TaxID=1497 RepID=A0AAC9RKJ8_9CLOT|nr:long-chain fatty acid--CoA ligase [Clostridium formicaceticum]AOY75655.1 AMP-dependent synthetase [Clostridium formicaceticum]ARE85970.1 Long-chain-fatty-acid--CoA ligase [Clostridium formicaceticum]